MLPGPARPAGLQTLPRGLCDALSDAGGASLVAILAVAPLVYDQALSLPPGDRRPVEFAFLAALSLFIALLGIGVLRRWRWKFWLIVVAFLFGVLRVRASLLELARVLPAAAPTWYVLVQALVGLLQFAIGLVMLVGYRRVGVLGGVLKPPRLRW